MKIFECAMCGLISEIKPKKCICNSEKFNEVFLENEQT